MANVPDIVDLVLYFLGGLSVLTWAVLIVKSYTFWRLKQTNKQVLNIFGNVIRLNKLDDAVKNKVKGSLSGLARRAIFDLKNLAKNAPSDLSVYAETLKQSLREERHYQQVRLESGLTVLASIGSVSPFIGLFGTVWGIMHALKSITATGSAGLDVVAGPIGEALIATAIGIATAIPAVLAYNYFLRQSRLAAADMDHFSERLQLLAKHSDYKVD
jgi:biopolymer transport protein ExbB